MKTFNHINNQWLVNHGSLKLCKLNREEYNGRRFYISPSGSRLTSVTTFLGHFKKDIIKQWRQKVGEEEANKISAKASSRGTRFHSLMESYLSNDVGFLERENISFEQKKSFMDMKPVVDRIDNIHYIETMLYSESFGLGGQVDCIADFDGVPSIIDFKTSNKTKREEWITDYFQQCTLYSLMYEEMTGIQCKQIVVLISVDGVSKPQVFVRDRMYYMLDLTKKIKQFRKETDS